MDRAQEPTRSESAPGLNLDSLERYLGARGYVLDRRVAVRRFPAGYGNMNFLLQVGGEPFVLRRPPAGPVPPGANDMGREFRILTHLHPVFPLVPKAELFCDDAGVIGAPFFLMEYRPGLVIGGEILSDTIGRWKGEEPIGEFLGGKIVDVLADLHAVDVEACGLGELGKPDGFVARTLRGWAKRADLSWANEAPAELSTLLEWLETHAIEPTSRPTLIHNDFKLDNIILDPETLEPRTLIDWDMGTLGDPLYDLAVLLSYWTEASDPEAMHLLRQMPTSGHGFPTREMAAALYSEASGRDLRDFTFCRVLATLRLAVVFQQLFRRYQSGAADDPKFAEFDVLARGLLRFGLQVARGEHF